MLLFFIFNQIFIWVLILIFTLRCHWIEALEHFLSGTLDVALWHFLLMLLHDVWIVLLKCCDNLLMYVLEFIVNGRLDKVLEEMLLPVFDDKAESVFKERLVRLLLLAREGGVIRAISWWKSLGLYYWFQVRMDLVLAECQTFTHNLRFKDITLRGAKGTRRGLQWLSIWSWGIGQGLKTSQPYLCWWTCRWIILILRNIMVLVIDSGTEGLWIKLHAIYVRLEVE